MAFPFTLTSKKEIFKGTFINEVSFKLYLPAEKEMVSYDKSSKLFKKLFGLNFDEFEYKRLISTRVRVGNSTDSVVFEFSTKFIKITINQSEYESFSTSLLPLIEKLSEAYSDWFDYCDKIELKYIDVWPMADIENIDDSKMILMENALFSYDMRSKSKVTDNNFKYLQLDDVDFTLDLQYGNFITEEESQNSGIALQTKCSSKSKKLKCGDIPKFSKNQNKILYNAFLWAVTPDVLNAMRSLSI